MMKRRVLILVLAASLLIMTACDVSTTPNGTRQNVQDTKTATGILTASQPTPTDIDYSLERYNLIRRAYWVNGQREKANTLICGVDKPLGYIVLFAGNAVVDRFVVDGKVTSLNSYLSPDSEYYARGDDRVPWLADVDGSYGENDNGIFFFTPNGNYIEWTGEYLYSDIPFEVAAPIVTHTEVGQ